MPLHVLCIGAHPDDNEITVGGTAALCRRRGDEVRLVSVTNGNRGHFAEQYLRDRPLLAKRRGEESARAAAVIGASHQCMGIDDGDVYVTPENTYAMIRLIRSLGPPGQGPDLVLFNRPNDYHRDHRYTSQLVLDASFMLTVPLICPDVPRLERMPVFAYWFDRFTEPTPFRPDVAVVTDDVQKQKFDMIGCHDSQVYEWLPYHRGELDRVPPDAEARRRWIEPIYRDRAARAHEKVKHLLPPGTQTAEVFQISEYGRQPDVAELASLFPGGRSLA